MRRALKSLALLLAVALLAGWPSGSLGGGGTGGGTGGGGSPPGSATLNDDFEADATGWSVVSGDWCRKKSGVGRLELTGPGLCIYNNATGNAGTVPTTDDQWAVAQVATTTTGVGFHMKDVASGGGNSIGVLWNSGTTLSIGTCDTGASCSMIDHAGATPGAPAVGDQIGVVVGGAGASTETCVWIWRAADADPSNWSNPSTWGNADACQSNGAITFLASYANCSSGTVCYTSEVMDFVPADGQTYVGFLSVTTTNAEWEWILAGDL